ncbi:hypothetical protein P170DRAFT_359716, partial [Aspergillus steynii IBT 23096]
SASIYNKVNNKASPDHPSTPSLFKYYLILKGGRSSAVKVLPLNIWHLKKKYLTKAKKYKKIVSKALFLRAKNL